MYLGQRTKRVRSFLGRMLPPGRQDYSSAQHDLYRVLQSSLRAEYLPYIEGSELLVFHIRKALSSDV